MEMRHFPLGTLLKIFTPSKIRAKRGGIRSCHEQSLSFWIYVNIHTYKVPLLSCYWICTRRLNFATLFTLGALPLGPPGATWPIWTTSGSSPLGITPTKFDGNLHTVPGDNMLFSPWAPYPNFDHLWGPQGAILGFAMNKLHSLISQPCTCTILKELPFFLLI